MKLIAYGLALMVLIFSPPTFSKEKDLKSYVILLVDFSNSYFTEGRKEVLRENFAVLTGAIVSKRKGPKRPVMMTVLPINDSSEASKKLCEFTILKKGLIKKPKESKNRKIDPDYFETYMNSLCINGILKEPVVGWTDIKGAVSLAGQFGDTQPKAQKYLVIFSDMFEFRDQRIPVTDSNLNQFKVLVVCSKELNMEKTGKTFLCMGEQHKWRAVFTKLGASEVVFVREGSDWGSEITKGLFRE